MINSKLKCPEKARFLIPCAALSSIGQSHTHMFINLQVDTLGSNQNTFPKQATPEGSDHPEPSPTF